MGAKIRAAHAREAAKQAIRKAGRAEAKAWLIRMDGYGGPAQLSPTIAQGLNSGLCWLEVECVARRGRAFRSMPSAGHGIRRSGSWKRRRNAGHARKAATRRRCT